MAGVIRMTSKWKLSICVNFKFKWWHPEHLPPGYKAVPDQDQAGQKDRGPWRSLGKLFSLHDNPVEGVAQ